MKIAIDCRMYGNEKFTGIGTYVQRLTNELFKLDAKNEYILFMTEPEFSKFSAPTDRVRKIRVNSPHYSYAEQFKLPFEFAKEKFDLIHYPHFNSPILYPKKSICTIHDITPLFFPGHKMKSIVRRLAYRLVFKATLSKARKVITISQSTKRDLVKYLRVNPKKIEVIYEGVDERFKPIENSDIIKGTKPFIFFVGVWRGHKNIESLVRAFNILKEKYKIPHQLVIGGRADLHYTKIQETIDQSAFKNDIVTPGYISDSDLPILYNTADVFCLPSFIEGFGLIAIEAQACGCPVVSTNTTSMPEILGDSAEFFDPTNVEQIAEQLYKVLSNADLRKKLIEKGFENVKRFSWKKCAEQTLAAYKSIK
ncbi:MAG: glycosyltransferase family 1 protein [Candidatus Falkowbacteria bacterium]